MSCVLSLPRLSGGQDFLNSHLSAVRRSGDDIAALRPIRAILSRQDYWQLNEHRRRCEDLGGPVLMRLAQLIRAKMSDATIIGDDRAYPDIVTGTSRVLYALDGCRLETCLLYQRDYPQGERGRPLSVGSFLGATLIGMTVGQHMPLLAEDGIAGELQVMRIQTNGIDCGMSFS